MIPICAYIDIWIHFNKYVNICLWGLYSRCILYLFKCINVSDVLYITGELYHCTICSNRFQHASDLKSHTAAVHGPDGGFPCATCPRIFRTKGALHNNRQDQHVRAAPFTCNDCDRSFKRKGSLVEHQRSRNGRERYMCPNCSKPFVSARTLKRHNSEACSELIRKPPVQCV